MTAAFRRSAALPVAILLTVGAVVIWSSGASKSTFVAAPDRATRGVALRGVSTISKQPALPLDMFALGFGAALLEAQPAQAYGIFYDELVPYASVTVFTIIWGIVLGFVLLRLQEAFPE
eukprot:CAMPEP_0172711644 /NCGR_PEP_ID=MMETSP1074-20121228/59777_1 /TAXON_ID=2916 /ORGANISM="Ceratium fusus, Strain PA161109" /LENGTH=118 /DNA_ID=CAMNT_0013535399 /DNA_START=72 /DNA_END=428 /DNA_ORIENTATION=+